MSGPGQMNYDYGSAYGAEGPAPQRMDNFGSDIGRSENKRRTEANRRQRKGQCPTCGNQTHKVNFVTRKRTPLTVEGKVIYGTCLHCHPIEGYIRPPAQQRGAHPETIEVSRTRGVTPSEDEYSIVSGITMEPELLRAASAGRVARIARMERLDEEGSGSNEISGSGGDIDDSQQGDRRQVLTNVAAERANLRNEQQGRISVSSADYSYDDNVGVFGAQPYDSNAYLPYDSQENLPHNASGESRRVMEHQVAESDRDLAGFDVGPFRTTYTGQSSLIDPDADITAARSTRESNVSTVGGPFRESSRSLGGFQINNKSSHGDLAYGQDDTSTDDISLTSEHLNQLQQPSLNDVGAERYKEPNYGTNGLPPFLKKASESGLSSRNGDDSWSSRYEQEQTGVVDSPGAPKYTHASVAQSLTYNDPPSVRGSVQHNQHDDDEAKTEISTPPAMRTRMTSTAGTPGSMTSTEIKKVEELFKDLSKPSLKSWKTGNSQGTWSVHGSSSRLSDLQSQHAEAEVASANNVTTSQQEVPNSAEQQSSEQTPPRKTDGPIILDCMKAYPENPLLHEKAFDAIYALATASDKECKDVILVNGGVEAVVEGMWRHMENPKIQLGGLFALWALVASGDETDMNDDESGAVSLTDATCILISMETHTHEVSIQQVGCGILSCLARGAGRNRQIDDGTSSGAINIVATAMRKHSASADMQEWGIRALYHECVNSRANKMILAEGERGGLGGAEGEGGIDVLYQAMNSFQLDLAIQEWGCRLLNCLSSDEKIAAALSVTAAGIEAVVNAMTSQKKNPKAIELREEACGALANLAVLTELNNAPIRGTRAIKALVDAMVLSPHAENVHTAACTALANLAVVRESRTVIMQSAGAKVVLSSMRNFPRCPLLQEEGCRLLRSMCSGDPGTKDFIVSNAAVTGIIRAMTLHPESKGVQEMAAALLASLADDESSRNQIFSLGGVEAISKAMLVHPRALGVQEACCTAFRNMSAHSTDLDKMISPSDLNAVVRAMTAHPSSEAVQENACCLFWNLPANSSMDAGEVKFIVKAMQNHPESARVQKVACGALWSLATSSDDIKDAIASEGGIDAVVCALLMCQDEIRVVEMALGVLSSLSSQRRIAKSIAEGGCIAAAVESMRNNVSSALLLRCGSLLLRNLAAFNANYAEEASSAISTILLGMSEHRNDGGVQREACGALWSLAAHSDTCRERILNSDGVDAITMTMRHNGDDEDVMLEARGAMALLV